MEPNIERPLILRPSHELTLRQTAPARVLNEMVASSLVLAREVAPAAVDLDALVREGKRVQRGEGRTLENIQAFKLFYQAATAGHSEAQYIVSNFYIWERGVDRDPVQSLRWLRMAAESGFAEAQNGLGGYYEFGCFGVPQDYVEAVKWFRETAERGDARGQWSLGHCYQKGHGVPQDLEQAAAWYRKAATQGHSSGQTFLGNCYRFGWGVPQDYAEAITWLRKAAEQGNFLAQWSLGSCYRNGHGVEIDLPLAYACFKLAADNGHETADDSALELEDSMDSSEMATAYELYEELNEDWFSNR